MNASFVRLLIFSLFLSTPAVLRAQSVEAVLGALQEREMVVQMKRTYNNVNQSNAGQTWKFSPIVWHEKVAPFPAKDSIQELPIAIAALNQASRAFDRLKYEFLAYDTTHHRFANLRFAGYSNPKQMEGAGWIGSTGAVSAPWTSSLLYDKSHFVTARLNLPSVGAFDESNWRVKLRALASNINQLLALEWPVLAQTARASFGEYHQDKNVAMPSFFKYNTGWTVSFPDFVGPFGANPPYTPVDTEILNSFAALSGDGQDWVRYPTPHSGRALSWSIGGRIVDGRNRNEDKIPPEPYQSGDLHDSFTGELKAEFTVGLKGKVGPYGEMFPVPGAPTLDGEIALFKGMAIADYGDLGEAISTASGGKLLLGSLTKVPFTRQQDGTFKIGSYPEGLSSNDSRAMETVLAQTFGWLGLPQPAITGSFATAPSPAPEAFAEYTAVDGGSFSTPYALTLSMGATHRRSYGLNYFAFDSYQYVPALGIFRFDILTSTVLIPKFTPLVIEEPRLPGIHDHVPGEVEPTLTYRELVRIHLGRGLNDSQQTAWLGTRSDGFGSLLFFGSPNEFEVLYDEDRSKYDGENEPFGGRIFDTALEFTDDQKTQTGWPSRFAYICDWFSPRLKQVKGGDVLVTIDYKTSYSKELKFYWAKDAGPLKDGFYSLDPSLQPFKTIVLRNPYAPTEGAGLPTKVTDLQVVEDGTRFCDIHVEPRKQYDGGPGTEERLTFKKYGAGGEAKWQMDVKIPIDENYWPQPWLITESRDGQTRNVEIAFNNPWSGTPYDTDRLEPNSIKVSAGAEERLTNYVWNGFAGGLSELSYSGPTSWTENGRVLTWGNYGLLASDKRRLGGKWHVSTHSWSGSTRTTSLALADSLTSLAGKTYSNQTAKYSDHLKQVDVKVGGSLSATLKHDGSGQLVSASYPGGFEEVYSTSASPTGISTTVWSGWGSGLTSGTVESTRQDRLGGMASYSLSTSEGVLLAAATGSDFTPWGAPKTVADVRGTKTKVTYYESGANWGALKSSEDPFGVTRTVGGYDWRLRPTSINTNLAALESLTMDYSQAGKVSVTSTSGDSRTTSFSAFGDMTSQSGVLAGQGTFSFSPGENSSVQMLGGSKTLSIDAFGIVQSVSKGLGSRGTAFDLGVENGILYTKATPMTKDGGTRSVAVQTFYDQKGRVQKITRPSEGGGSVTDQWNYDDAYRTVTFTPGDGPLSQVTKRVISPDGSKVTVSEGGMERWRIRREVDGGALAQITELNDDSSGAGWSEVSRKTVNPAAGTTVSTPWGLTTNSVTLTQPPPSQQGTATFVDGTTGTSLLINLQKGLPSTINGTVEGVAVDMNSIGFSPGRFTGMSGTIAGKPAGLSIGADRRLSNLWGPGTNQVFEYTNPVFENTPGTGFAVTATDSVQGVTSSAVTDDVGDFVSSSSNRSVALSATGTTDTSTGSETTLNGSVTIQSNLQGSLVGKSYAGGTIKEGYTLNSDGSRGELSVQGPGGSETVSINELPGTRTRSYPGNLTITESFFAAGPRKNVTAPGDGRSFLYKRGELLKETHNAGPWNGWQVERLPDDHGRLGTLRISGGGIVRDTTFGYDDFGRLEGVAAPGMSDVTYGWHPTGQLWWLSCDGLGFTYGRDDEGKLLNFTNSGAASSFAYTFPRVVGSQQIAARQATSGASWTGLSYDGIGQLKGATVSGGRTLAYGYNGRGGRLNQGEGVVEHTINGLDQISARSHLKRGFGVSGAVALQPQPPQPTLRVFHPLTSPAGEALTVQPGTGSFFGVWDLPSTWNSGSAGRIDVLVRGTLPGAGQGGSDAVADAEFHMFVPPAQESPVYDAAGRLKEDAYWKYDWDGAGRLTQLTRKPGVMPEPEAKSEVLSYGYDADGRRTVKQRTIVYEDGHSKVEESYVLWSGWLPVMEERTRDGGSLGRRFFLWGADLSGSLEGAGGIGGLVAIREENASGQTQRLLRPVQDGLGNVTAVFDQATGDMVARYDYGPFGEPLGEYGEADACPFRFQTKWYDIESEHYYFGYRYYSPRFGSWLSRDPLGESGGFNLYAYCGNDPVNRHDPLGMDWYNNWDDFNFVVLGGISEGLTQGQENLRSFGEGLQSGKDKLSEFMVTLATDPKKIGRGISETTAAVGTYYGNVSVDSSLYFEDFRTGLGLISESLDSQEKVFHVSGELIFNLVTAAAGGELANGLSRSTTALLPNGTAPEVAGASMRRGSRFASKAGAINPQGTGGVTRPFSWFPSETKGIMGEISDRGIVSFVIEAGEGSPVRGTEMFKQMMQHFGRNAKGIQGTWHYGDNLGAVNKLTSSGMSIEEAATQTWTARRAAEYGFSRVRVLNKVGEPGRYTAIKVLFE